jgi:hypothetical protein
MNTQLDPPTVPPLSAAERSRLRNRVMDKVRPAPHHPARRWIAPAVGVAAVATVVAGTLVVTGNRSADPGVAGKPAPSSASTASDIPKVDRGALPPAVLPDLQAACRVYDTKTVKMLWTRQVRGVTSGTTKGVAVAVARGQKIDPPRPNTTTINLGVMFCDTNIPSAAEPVATGGGISVTDEAWTARPTAAQGLVQLCTCGFALSKDRSTLQKFSLFRPRPEIARIEARSVWKGKFGEWTEGVVDGGFAYTQAEAHGKFTNLDHIKQEVRAFDAAGKPVPVNIPWPG